VALLLKGGSRFISLHGVTELDESFEFGGKRVYTFAPPQLIPNPGSRDSGQRIPESASV
jgi:hypothetical protein